MCHEDIWILMIILVRKLSRINVIQSVVEKRMLRCVAACQLNLTEQRHTQHFLNRFRESCLRDLPVFVVDNPEIAGYRNHLSSEFFHWCAITTAILARLFLQKKIARVPYHCCISRDASKKDDF